MKTMDSSAKAAGKRRLGVSGTNPTRRDVLALAALGLVAGAPGSAGAAGPEGQLTWGAPVSLALA